MSSIQTPEWVKHAVFYQIFPDRFAKSGNIDLPKNIKFVDWNSKPSEKDFFGGDLYGVIDKLDYLSDLGINALYLNPIFSSTSNHRYNTFDYFSVDPLLGGDEAFKALLVAAHNRGMKVILDAVFNHVGRGFYQFNHILENGNKSPYIDWFIIYDWPLRPYRNTKDKPINYEAWWGYPELPKLNMHNLAVREYIFDVVNFWMDYGIDGWRIDVPMEIRADGFWEEFRQVVKAKNPEAYIVGEVWSDAKEWLEGDRFDGVMNYPFASSAINFFGAKTLNIDDFSHDEFKITPFDADKFGKTIDYNQSLYDWQINCTQLNLLDSHDMPRALRLMGEDKSAMKLAVLFQMTMPGAPCVYYGDEFGLSAGSDPECRGTMPWGKDDVIDFDLVAFYKRVIELRNSNKILRTGNFKTIIANDGLYGFSRAENDKQALVVFNSNENEVKINIHESQNITDIWTFSGWQEISNGTIRVKEREGIVVFFSDNSVQQRDIKILS